MNSHPFNPIDKLKYIDRRFDRTFFISKKKEIAYLNIAKSGCTSIKTSLTQLRDKTSLAQLHDATLAEPHEKVHEPLYYYLYFLDVVKEDCNFLKDCFKFTFVRNPIQRAISFYKNKILAFDQDVTPYYESIGLKQNMPFEKFVAKLVTVDHSRLDQHLADQYIKVIDRRRIVVDFIGKIEEMDAHWQIFNDYIDEDLPMKRMNRTTIDSSITLSEEMITLLKKYFEIDTVLFGYEKSIPVPKEMKDLKEKIDKTMAENFTGKKMAVNGHSQNELEALDRYRKRKSLPPLNDDDIDTIKDMAIFLEKIEPKRALKLMSIAKKLRPKGPLIRKKVKEYEKLIESQE